MFTDTVGYTASTQEDESGTLELLRQQQKLVAPIVATHGGRTIKSTGDGALVEFESALRATECAVDIQRQIHERNADRPARAIQVRIGIHLGDVVAQGGDIVGDAVNIAARIEPLAPPGGVCVSGAVREQVWNKIPHQLEKLGPRSLKGLRLPVEVYGVVLPWTSDGSAGEAPDPNRLAVLPFSSISPDPKDEYVADGLTEEMITVLSRLQGVRVFARTSVLPYKAAPKPIPQIGSELLVGSVLEGSVRKSGTRIRVTVQLIDVASQEHRWAETYDRELDDVFALQDEIARRVAEVLRVELGKSASPGSRESPASASYLATLHGRALIHEGTARALAEARDELRRAIALDASNAAAYAGLADALYMLNKAETRDRASDSRRRELEEWERTVAECRRLATRAVELDPSLAEGHLALGRIFLEKSIGDAAASELKQAIELSPSLSEARILYADVLFRTDRAEETLDQLRLAAEASPLPTPKEIDIATNAVGLARRGQVPDGSLAIYFALIGRRDKVRELLPGIEALPDTTRWKAITLAAIHAYAGDADRAFEWLERAIDRHETTAEWWERAPRLDSIRTDPRFAQLLGRDGFR